MTLALWRRADAASKNGFEALPLFAAAVLIAQLLRGPRPAANLLAAGFIAARLVHLACYLADRSTPRSIFWFIGLLCVIGLFMLAA